MAIEIAERLRNAVPNRHRATTAVVLALVAAVLVDLVSLRTSSGAGLALGALVVVSVTASGAFREHAGAGHRLAAASAIVIGAMIAVRSSEAMTALNIVAVVGLCLVVAGSYATPRPGWKLMSLLGASISSGIGIVRCAMGSLRTAVGATPFDDRLARWRPVLLGGVIAVPVLFVFLVLFASADAVFADYLEGVMAWRVDLGDGVFHGIAIAVLAVGLLGVWMLGIDRPEVARPNIPAPPLPAASAATLLSLVVALFSLFVLVQLAYLFGGDQEVVRGGYTYAEYARRGFFELVVVAGLVLGLLLVTDWLVQNGRRRNRTVDVLAVALIALTYVVVASAIRRMLLYVSEFGLTELRLYTTAFMAWTAIVLTWFVFTVLRGDRDRFGAGVVAASVVLVLGLNVVNPDDLIARIDVDRHSSGVRELDGAYVSSLGSDAVPALMSPVALARCDVVAGLETLQLELERQSDEEGWRGITLADRTARVELASTEFLRAADQCR